MTRRKWIEDSLGSKSAALVQRDAATFFYQDGSTPCLSALRGVEGPWIEDLDGNRYFDLHGNTVHHLGHAHPRIVAALHRQLDELPFSPRRYTNETAIELAEKLVRLWPGRRAKVLFATGGSDAIEISLRLALVATKRRGIVSLEGSYHGHGFGALGLSSAKLDPRLAVTTPDRYHVTPYWDHANGGADRMISDIRQAFASAAGGIAAVIAEPMRSNCHVPPAWLWPEVREICTQHGAKLIFDEIPTGLGKTGRLFAFSHFGVVPDAIVLGKSLGGGMLPIAAVLAESDLDVAPELNLGHYTHEKNPLTARAALTTIEVIEEEGLVDRAARLGELAADAFTALAGRNSRVRGYRGMGLLGAIELAGDSSQPGSTKSLADAAIWSCLRQGISTVTKPGGAIGFSPPLIIGESDIAWLIDRIERALVSL